MDNVLDVRPPAAWAEDRVPGAALEARNAARHLERYLADKPARDRPLVRCRRGHRRSGSFALILGQTGWQVRVPAGARIVADSLAPVAPPGLCARVIATLG